MKVHIASVCFKCFRRLEVCCNCLHECCKNISGMLHMLPMLQLFQRSVAIVCFKCFRCFRGMFHLCFPNVCCKCVYLDDACVSHIRCILFGCLCMVAMGFKCLSGVFSNVSKACFNCFNCLQTYVATVVFGCFQSRSGVASLLPTFCCIVSLGAGRASIQCRCQVLPNRRRRVLPLLSLGRHGPRVERETGCSARSYRR